MKKRTKIVTFTLAILLVGSIAYAAEKRRQSKLDVQESDMTSEEEALKTELLAASEVHQGKMTGTEAASPEKNVNDSPDAGKENVKVAGH